MIKLEWASLEFEQSQISPTALPLPPPLLEIVPALQISEKNEKIPAIAIFAECSINQALNLSDKTKMRENKRDPELHIYDAHSSSLQMHDNSNRISPAHDTSERKDNKYTEESNSSYHHGRLSRDERQVLEKNVPFNLLEIIHTPMERFTDLLSGQDITEEQVTICRDIRRRGKNKLHFHYRQFYLKNIDCKFPDCC